MENHNTPDRQSEDQQAVVSAAVDLFEQLSEDAQNAILDLLRTIVNK